MLAASFVIGFAPARWFMRGRDSSDKVAYATCNDATRYLMMVRYMRDNVWNWGDFVGTFYPLWDRPLEHTAGATFASLFPISAAIADSLAASIAIILAGAAFCLIYEGLF